ncbi:hypothetical protein COS74_00485 [bacterium CG06_land_8_20_14_3_00_33_50]|nr:MAG: hypothetical protein COS74_00485 [bacterium CG06_land_8_20_14_3_00_33_50]
MKKSKTKKAIIVIILSLIIISCWQYVRYFGDKHSNTGFIIDILEYLQFNIIVGIPLLALLVYLTQLLLLKDKYPKVREFI